MPDGVYLIQPTAPTEVGIWVNAGGVELFSNTRLQMNAGAVLKAKPNARSVYKVLRVFDADNVEISGGTILDERLQHGLTLRELLFTWLGRPITRQRFGRMWRPVAQSIGLTAETGTGPIHCGITTRAS